MLRKILLIVMGVVVVTMLPFGYLLVKHLLWESDMPQKVETTFMVSRVSGYFGEPEEVGLLDVLGLELVDGDRAPYSSYKSTYVMKTPMFNPDKVNQAALDKLVKAYNSDPSNSEKISSDDILSGLQRDFVSDLLECDTAYSPDSQPYPFIDWCLTDADIVYETSFQKETAQRKTVTYNPGDSAYWWLGGNHRIKENDTYIVLRTLSNYAYVMYGDELFEADTAFRWEYEANQGESV